VLGSFRIRSCPEQLLSLLNCRLTHNLFGSFLLGLLERLSSPVSLNRSFEEQLIDSMVLRRCRHQRKADPISEPACRAIQ
jgi:hypothetical protein